MEYDREVHGPWRFDVPNIVHHRFHLGADPRREIIAANHRTPCAQPVFFWIQALHCHRQHIPKRATFRKMMKDAYSVDNMMQRLLDRVFFFLQGTVRRERADLESLLGDSEI